MTASPKRRRRCALPAHSKSFFHSEPVNQRRDDRLGKAPRDAHHRRIFFIKKVAWIVGEFKLTAKNKILIVVKHAVVVLIAHGGFGAQAAGPAARDIYQAFFKLKNWKPTP